MGTKIVNNEIVLKANELLMVDIILLAEEGFFEDQYLATNYITRDGLVLI